MRFRPLLCEPLCLTEFALTGASPRPCECKLD